MAHLDPDNVAHMSINSIIESILRYRDQAESATDPEFRIAYQIMAEQLYEELKRRNAIAMAGGVQ